MSDQSTDVINYAALKPRDELKPWSYIILAGVVLFFLALIVMSILEAGDYQAPHPVPSWEGMLPAGFGIFMALLSAGLIIYAWKEEKNQQKAFKRFLNDNGWKALSKSARSKENVATSLLGVGYNQRMGDAFAGTYMGTPFVMAVYEYTVGYGKSSETHNFLNLHFKLPKKFPLIVLDDKRNNTFNVFSDLPSRIPNSRTLQFEGNFNERYRVTVLPGAERDVLHVLTPDFMAELLDEKAVMNGELVADNLFVMRGGETYDKKSLHNMFAFAGVMLKNLAELSPTWQSSSSAETIESIASTAIKPPHQAYGPAQAF